MLTPAGLNYTIEFPELGSADIKEESTDDQNENNSVKVSKPIVVIMLGWVEAKDGHLKKYSDIYSKRGCITLRAIAPPRTAYGNYGALPLLAQEVIEILKGNNLQSHPIFFHAFSNGGAYLYSQILREIAAEANPNEFDVRGTIFDSSPFTPTMKTAYRAAQAASSSFTKLGMIFAPLFGIFLGLYAFFQAFWTMIKLAWELVTIGSFRRLASNEQKEEPYPLCNFLTRIWKLKNHSFAFLYSESDTVTPYKEVEQLADVIGRRGNRVERVKFEGSAHVLHYKMYPKEYVEVVMNFVRATMKSYPGPAIYFEG